MSGSQKNHDGLDPEETVSEDTKKVDKVKFTKIKTITSRHRASNVSAIETQVVDDDNSVVAYVKGHVKWKCSGKSGEPPVLMLKRFDQNTADYTEIILGSYEYPQNPSEELVTLAIDVQLDAEDISGQCYFYV